MSHEIRIRTRRLMLRPFAAGDAAAVQTLAGAFEIADTTLRIPHPYRREMAVAWIASHKKLFQNDEEVVFTVTLQCDARLIGAISLMLQLEHDQAEMGYWIGKPFWSKGYASEAATSYFNRVTFLDRCEVAVDRWTTYVPDATARPFASSPCQMTEWLPAV
jgi:RimJ/RimL family protein N-acetyltransferase